MGTDNWPSDFVYISHRLTRDIVNQHEAARRARRLSRAIALGPIRLSLGPNEPDYANPYDLVRRATQAVEDNTGNVADPGQYIRVDVPLTVTKFPVHLGWADEVNQEIAGFFASVRDPDAGHVFLGLFGSVSNYIGHRPEASRKGWFPSSVEGLYQILDSTREPDDPPIDADFIANDLEPSGDVAAFVTATTLLHHFGSRFPARTLAILARVIIRIDGPIAPYGSGRSRPEADYDRVLLGAPIWVATPDVQPIGDHADRIDATDQPQDGGAR